MTAAVLAYGHTQRLGHTMERAAVWTAVRRVVDRIPIGLVTAGVVVLVLVVVGGWALRRARSSGPRW